MPLLTPTDLSHEQESVLNADAANIQALLAHAEVLGGAAYAAEGKTISQHAINEVDDFHGRLSDLISELQSAYDLIDQELDRRDAVKEREHERIESAQLTKHLSAAE